MSVKWSINSVPTVMFDTLLEQCALKTYCETPEAHKIVKEEGFEFSKVEILKLEFKNILKITNLWRFTSLKELDLSNNKIEKIQGLDALVNLLKLDLSFNRIEEIGGLDYLKSLTDLSLSHNKIIKIEKLGALKNLKLVALNNNAIEDFESIKYLYTFNTIRSACFRENPFAQDDDYKLKVIAYLPNLIYLDYRLISDEQKTAALEKFKNDVYKLEDAVKTKEKMENDVRMKEDTDVLFSAAFLGNFYDKELFDTVMGHHIESQKLLTFATLTEEFNEFSTAFYNISEEGIKVSLKEHERRKKEIDDSMSAEKNAIETNLEDGRTCVLEFAEQVEDFLLSLYLSNKDELGNSKLKAFNETLAIFCRMLLSSENALEEQISSMRSKFFLELNKLVEEFSSVLKMYISKLVLLTKEYVDIAIKFYMEWASKSLDQRVQLAKAAGGEYSRAELEELLKLLKKDEEALLGILNEGCEKREALLLDRENLILSGLTFWHENIIGEFKEQELERHRHRLREIAVYFEKVKSHLEACFNV